MQIYSRSGCNTTSLFKALKLPLATSWEFLSPCQDPLGPLKLPLLFPLVIHLIRFLPSGLSHVICLFSDQGDSLLHLLQALLKCQLLWEFFPGPSLGLSTTSPGPHLHVAVHFSSWNFQASNTSQGTSNHITYFYLEDSIRKRESVSLILTLSAWGYTRHLFGPQ